MSLLRPACLLGVWARQLDQICLQLLLINYTAANLNRGSRKCNFELLNNSQH